MYVIALVSSKGGSGKSMLSACLAVAGVEAGHLVFTLDTDPQGSLTAWATRRSKRGLDDVVHHHVEPRELSEQIERIKGLGGASLVIVDTAGVADRGAILAARVADLILVPVQPTQTDYDAVQVTAKALQAASIHFAFVVNRAASLDRARDAARSLVRVGTVAPAWTGSRVIYDDAIAEGRGVTEVEPRGRAAEEIKALWDWTAKQMGNENAAKA